MGRGGAREGARGGEGGGWRTISLRTIGTTSLEPPNLVGTTLQISASSTLDTLRACAKQRKSTDQAVNRSVSMWRTAKTPVATETSKRERGRERRGGR